MVGATKQEYLAINSSFKEQMPISNAIPQANDATSWNPNSLQYDASKLMVKLQDYVPPVKDELKYQ